MIANVTTGNSFKKLFDYLLKPTKEAEVIGGNYGSESPTDLAYEFRQIASQRPSTKKPVKHIVISFSPEDGEVDPRTKHQIASSTLAHLGYTENQWVAISHGRDDPDHHEPHHHDHLHIVVNMITYLLQRIRDSFDKRRTMEILRELEIKHQLKQVKPSFERLCRRPQKGRYKKFEKAYYQYLERAKQFFAQPDKKDLPEPMETVLPQPPREPEIQELESIIVAASEDRPTMSIFLARMQQAGYRVEQYEGKVSKRSGEPRKRFRYYLKSTQRPIYKVNGASRAKLLKRVDYLPQRDDPNIIKAGQGMPLELPESLCLTEEMVARYRYQWLNPLKDAKIRETIASVSSPSMTAKLAPSPKTKAKKSEMEL